MITIYTETYKNYVIAVGYGENKDNNMDDSVLKCLVRHIKFKIQFELLEIETKEINNYYISELFRNIDFAIFDKDYKKVLLLIEINDKTHSSKKRMARDIKVERIVNQAGIKLIKFYSNYPNKKEYIKDRIKKQIISISNLEF